MKIVVDIDEEDKKDIGNLHFIRESLKFKVGKAIMNGIPFDSVIEDIKAEIEDEQNPYLPFIVYGGFAGGYYDGLAKALKIIDYHKYTKEKE